MTPSASLLAPGSGWSTATLAILCALVLLVGTVAPADAEARPAILQRDYACIIQPWDVVGIASAIEGRIETIAVERGDLVEAGQVVVTLDASVERAAVAAAQARSEFDAALRASQVRIDFGIRRLERTEDMYRKELIPLKELDEAETGKLLAELSLLEAEENRRLAHLDLERARAVLALKTIRSPVSGVILERLLSPGEASGAGPILRVARLDPLRVETFLPVDLLGQIEPDMLGRVIPEVGDARPVTATVAVVDRVADPASGTFGVRLALPNPGHRLPAGTRCRVRFWP